MTQLIEFMLKIAHHSHTARLPLTGPLSIWIFTLYKGKQRKRQ